jgi:hypothetical protein
MRIQESFSIKFHLCSPGYFGPLDPLVLKTSGWLLGFTQGKRFLQVPHTNLLRGDVRLRRAQILLDFSQSGGDSRPGFAGIRKSFALRAACVITSWLTASIRIETKTYPFAFLVAMKKTGPHKKNPPPTRHLESDYGIFMRKLRRQFTSYHSLYKFSVGTNERAHAISCRPRSRPR